MDKIPAINKAIKEYFDLNNSIDEVRPKELMGWLIKKGVFTSDNKEGRPLRDILRELDEKDQLHRIPSAHAERKVKNRNWYFIRSQVKEGNE